MTRFGSFFDSGIVPRYMRMLNMSDSDECIEQLHKEHDVIYQAYEPLNIL